jgi:hypothetical protein
MNVHAFDNLDFLGCKEQKQNKPAALYKNESGETTSMKNICKNFKENVTEYSNKKSSLIN